MYIKFEDNTQLRLTGYPTASAAVIENHKRDVLTATVEGEYSAVRAAFNGQGWSIADCENEYDKSNYTLVASITDNMDGTCTVRVGRANTVEEDLRDSNAALTAENAAQADIINILAGGAA